MKQSEMNRIFGQEMEALNMVLADRVRNRQKAAAMIAANKISGAAGMACALELLSAATATKLHAMPRLRPQVLKHGSQRWTLRSRHRRAHENHSGQASAL